MADIEATQPVTTIVRQTVPAAKSQEYDEWLRRLLSNAETLDGYLGTDVHPPGPGDDQYTIVFRFASIEQLQVFQRSDTYRAARTETRSIVETDPIFDTYTGFEFWFSPPPGTTVPQPVRWRIVVALGTIVYFLVLVFGAIAEWAIGAWPAPLRLAIVIAAELTLMTYLVMPWLTKHFARWIYPKAAQA